MRIKDISIEEVVSGKNWRLEDSNFPSKTDWMIEDVRSFDPSDIVVYSALSIDSEYFVTPILMVKEVRTPEWKRDSFEYYDSKWNWYESKRLTRIFEDFWRRRTNQNFQRYINSFVGNPLKEDPYFFDLENRDKHQKAFSKWKHFLMPNRDYDKGYVDWLRETLVDFKMGKISLEDLNEVSVQMEKDWKRLFYPTPDKRLKNYSIFRLADELIDLTSFENENFEFTDEALEIIGHYVGSNEPERMFLSDPFQKMISRRAPIGESLELFACTKCGFEYPVPHMSGFEDLNQAWCQDCKHLLFFNPYDPRFKTDPPLKNGKIEYFLKLQMELLPKCKCGGSFTLFWSSEQCPSCGNKTFNKMRVSRYQYWQEGKASLLPG